ncbi:MAG: dihydroorotase [Oscillospiraceae bacterium]
MLIKNALLVDANGSFSGDISIENGIITAIGNSLEGTAPIIDAKGSTVMPSFIDMHCHFRTPGFEHKEDILSGSRAAAHGGYTFVNCMANTKPVCSSAAIADSVMEKAKEINICDVNQCVSITENLDGKTTEHLKALPPHIRFISDDGCGVQDSLVMLNAMEIAAKKGLTILSHAEDKSLSPVDYRLAEDLETLRNLHLAKSTGARLHMCHVSTIGSLAAIQNARRCGLKVTFEVTPHHIWFAKGDYRVNPPIRTENDVNALIAAMKNGEVDAIATDHAPHTAEDKANGAPGMVGLETAFGVCYTKLCLENDMPLSLLSRMMSAAPAAILRLNKGYLRPGYDGDIVMVNTTLPYTVHKEDFYSKGRNTPWDGAELQGKIELTVKQGEITYRAK